MMQTLWILYLSDRRARNSKSRLCDGLGTEQENLIFGFFTGGAINLIYGAFTVKSVSVWVVIAGLSKWFG